MADISKVTLPSGSTYDLKDAEARELISGLQNYTASGVQYIGTTTTELVDGATTSPIVVDDKNVTPVTGSMVNYNNVMYAWNGSQWDQLGTAGAFHALAYKDSVTSSYTPTGKVDNAKFTGTPVDVTVTGTPAGTVSGSFTGAAMTSTGKYTPAGDVSVSSAAPATGETANYTPAGTVTLTPTNGTVKAVKSVGTPSDFSATVTDETLVLGFTKGSAATTEDASVLSGVTASFTGTGTVLKAGFTGTEKDVSVSGTTAGSVTGLKFEGSQLSSTGSVTAAGSVSAEFTGNAATIESK